MAKDELVHVCRKEPKTKNFKILPLPVPPKPNYRLKAKNRRASKLKKLQARHMRKQRAA